VLVELLNSLPLGILLHFLWILTLLGIGLRWARADIETSGEILFWGVFSPSSRHPSSSVSRFFSST